MDNESKRKRGREGRVFPLSAGFHFHIKHRFFSLSNSLYIIPITPLLLLMQGSQSLRVCSTNVQRALFLFPFFSLSYAICISVGVETDDRMPIEAGNEQGEKLFHTPMMPCQLSLSLPPTL